jgi:hydroxymethylbilane synthase
MKAPLRIGTRGSQLALWQARWVQQELSRHCPERTVDLVIIKTQGDKIQDVPLAKVGGKGLFVKEIEEALLDGRIDLAVHSMKDMPADLPEGLTIGAVPRRENPLDALLSKNNVALSQLPHAARVGTSSLRRSAQLLYQRPDLKIVALRGNLDTRLKKLAETDLDAIVLAAAGLIRLEQTRHITAYLAPSQMLPAVGQGALCIEHRANNPLTTRLLSLLEHAPTRIAVTAERAFLRRLEGGCQVPIAAHGTVEEGGLRLTGLVADITGKTIIKSSADGPCESAGTLGVQLAEALLAKGADTLLESMTSNG